MASWRPLSFNHPPRSNPPRHPPRTFGILRFEARQLHTGVRAVNERLFADIHPHMRDAATGLGREQQDVSGPQRIERGSHFAPGARLITTHAREADTGLAIGPLHEARAIKAVLRGPAPHV